jgi:hypothetical protein
MDVFLTGLQTDLFLHRSPLVAVSVIRDDVPAQGHVVQQPVSRG